MSSFSMSSLAVPSPDAQAHSARVTQRLREEIAHGDGWIPFARYMELALYAPGLGYYAAGATKFGIAGDFTTAPEMSALFGRSLARQVRQVLQGTRGDVLEDVLEIGAGSGKLAADLLLELEKLGALPERYLILELSAELKTRQFDTLTTRAPHLLQRVSWLDQLPERFSGVMLGNEVLDAMPIHIVTQRDGVLYERGVAANESGFEWNERPCDSAPLRKVAEQLALPDGYLIEINLAAPAFVASLAERLRQGVILLIDYGFGRGEYYHPQRDRGTLMCHYRHHTHDDPFLWPGLQDITAHVDFTSIAEAGAAHGLDLLGYASQASFLINCGITAILSETSPNDTAAYLPLANQAQRLLSPAEMGELFKAIALGRDMAGALVGFSARDLRHRL
jgi:SAM-dependent MidA family methyltransferase